MTLVVIVVFLNHNNKVRLLSALSSQVKTTKRFLLSAHWLSTKGWMARVSGGTFRSSGKGNWNGKRRVLGARMKVEIVVEIWEWDETKTKVRSIPKIWEQERSHYLHSVTWIRGFHPSSSRSTQKVGDVYRNYWELLTKLFRIQLWLEYSDSYMAIGAKIYESFVS